MTDQDAYTLASWIERARKAEAALLGLGWEQDSNGWWDRPATKSVQYTLPPAAPSGDPAVFTAQQWWIKAGEQSKALQEKAGATVKVNEINFGGPWAGMVGVQRSAYQPAGACVAGLPPIDYDTRG